MKTIMGLLIRLFPSGFRAQFGRDLVEHVRDEHDRAWSRGPLRGLWYSIATALDLVRSAIAERLEPAWVAGGPDTSESEGVGWLMSGWTKDIRHAMRALRRTPGFTAVSIATLGLAIGANAGIFSVVDTVLLDPLPYPDADRLVYIAATAPGSDLPEEFGVSAEFFVQYSEQSTMLEDVALTNSFTSTLRADERVERVWMSSPTASLFSTLGVKPILGRLPVDEDESRVAVISHALWTTWFGSDFGVIGRSYYMSGADREIIGVMGPDFRYPVEGTLLWFPTPVRAERIVPGRFGAPMVGRLAPGATLEGLTAELHTLAQRLPERFGGSAAYARLIERHRPIVRPLRDEVLGDISGPLWVLLGSVGIVLLIACANVANLFMVRGEQRQRDLAIRRAIGAGRGQLFRSQMAESLVVALFAGALAVVLARASVPAFLRAAPPNVPRLGDVSMTVPTLLFTLGVCLLSALLCGLIPAIRASSPNVAGLRDGSRGSTRRRHWGRDGLVIAQTALALVLLIGSGLLIRSFQQLRSVDPGYDTADIFTFQIAPERASLNDAQSFAAFHMDFMDRLAALPGVESVGLVENVPLDEGTSSGRFATEEEPDIESGALLSYTWAGGDYFGTMSIQVLTGRAFTQADHISDLGNVVISKSAADMLWPGENPIGRRLRPQGAEAWETVVGVVEDVMQNGFRDSPQALVYFPLVGQSPGARIVSSPAYVMRTGRAENIAPEVRALVSEVAPEAPMYRVYTMAGLAAASMVQLSFTMLALGITSVLALILGTVGLYGVLSYVVAERTREIGVRMALGAEAKSVQRMVVGQGIRVVIIGVVIGVLVARASTRALSSLLFGVEAADLATFVGMSGAMLLVGLLASYVPARRASSVDPIESLRE
ncbi:MAG TPA: ABC transporter permease [Longimicrobiales bacterium]|nr:ABC transporter permease [Longimicrobiales bacterium]